MPPANQPPQFHFDTPPPFTYEVFSTVHFPKMLDIFEGPGGEFLRDLQRNGADEFLKRLFYLMIVVKIQNPDMSKSGMLYAISYGLIRYSLDQGQTPEVAREELSKVPWDFLPGMDDYSRETTNAVAMRAFEDAVAGRPQSPLH